MTTIINTPPNRTETVSTDGGAGWMVAIIMLLAVAGVGVYLWFYYDRTPNEPGDTTINVTLPTPTVDTPATQ